MHSAHLIYFARLYGLLRCSSCPDVTLLTLACIRVFQGGGGAGVLPFISYIASAALKDGFFNIPLVQQRV